MQLALKLNHDVTTPSEPEPVMIPVLEDALAGPDRG
jgi:hypothetical protein